MAIDRHGRIEPRELDREMSSSYLDYAMSVIVGRALPDVRDGLKPVHRRVLFAMHDMGLQPERAYVKSANIVGRVMGEFHPHGDQSIYDTLVRLAQDFASRYPLVDGQGNFGSSEFAAAAMRYTEAKLSRLATEMLRDIDEDTVDDAPTYDDRRSEPLVLPSRIPNLLVNGSSGIAVGMATNIPPHNLGEVIDAVVAQIDDPAIEVEGLMRHIKAPDFPTGGIIVGRAGVVDAYRTGRGRIVVRGRAHNEPLKHGRNAIVFTELPYQVNKAELIRKMADLANDKVIPEISDLRDESGRDGVRVVIELRRDAVPMVVLNKLYKHTADADHLRGQRDRAGGRRAAHARPEGPDPPLHRAPEGGGHPPVALPPRARRGPGPHPRGAPQGARAPRRGHRADPRRRRPRDGPQRPDVAVRPHRDPGAGDPRPAPPAPHPARGREDPGRVPGAAGPHRRAAGDPRRRAPRLRADPRGAARDPRAATPTSAAPRSSRARATSTSRT